MSGTDTAVVVAKLTPVATLTDDEILSQLKHITTVVRRHVHNDHAVDIEQLSLDIWLECFQRHIGPSIHVIRSRCIDVLRRLKLERQTLKDIRTLVASSLTHLDTTEPDAVQSDRVSLVSRIMQEAKLSSSDTRLLYLRFYQGMSYREI